MCYFPRGISFSGSMAEHLSSEQKAVESHLEYCSNQKIPGSNPGQDSCLVGPTVRRLTTE